MKPLWLDRDLVRSPYCLSLCTTPEMFLAEQRRLKVRPDQIHAFPKTGAKISYFDAADFTDPDVRPAMIVTVSAEDVHPIQVAALIVHEAVHAVERMMEDLGEKTPSSEFRAYATQGVAQNLMYEYARQKGLK